MEKRNVVEDGRTPPASQKKDPEKKGEKKASVEKSKPVSVHDVDELSRIHA